MLKWYPDKRPPNAEEQLYTDQFQKTFNAYKKIDNEDKKRLYYTNISGRIADDDHC